MKTIKHTAKVDRGLALVKSLLIAACDDSKPPTLSIMAKWKAPQRADFNAAMDWISWRTERASEPVTPEAPTDNPA